MDVIEYVFIENFLITMIVLETVALINKEKARWILLSSFVNSCFIIMIPLLNVSFVGSFLIELGFAVITLSVSFKYKTIKKFFRLYLSHFIVSFAYGGICFYFERLFGTKSILLFLICVFSMFFIIRYLTMKLRRKNHIENFVYEVSIYEKGEVVECKGFLDSGNILYDPISQCPVSLINCDVFFRIFQDLKVEDLICKSKKLKLLLKFMHYIDFNTLNSCDKLLVFQVDKIRLNGNRLYEKPILGLAIKNFNESLGADIILHNNYI